MGTEAALRPRGERCLLAASRKRSASWVRFPCNQARIDLGYNKTSMHSKDCEWRKRMGIEPTPLADTGAGLRF